VQGRAAARARQINLETFQLTFAALAGESQIKEIKFSQLHYITLSKIRFPNSSPERQLARFQLNIIRKANKRAIKVSVISEMFGSYC